MRILFLALDVNPTSTGGEFIHLSSVALAWDALGHEVCVVLPDTEGALAATESSFKSAAIQVHLNRGRSDIGTLSSCMEVLKEFGPDVIYERRFSPKIGVALKTLSGVPLAVEINGLIEQEAAFSGKITPVRSLTSRPRSSLRRFLFNSCDLVVAVTDGIRDALIREQGVNPDLISVVYNGADIDMFRAKQASDAKRAVGLREENDYLCYVGSMQPWHELESMIRGFKLILEDFPQLKLLMIGKGALSGEIENLTHETAVSDHVVFTGYVPHVSVSDYVNSSLMCFALFKKAESGFSPLKVYEYLACQKPVLASRHRGLEFLETEKCGLVVSSSEPEKIAEAIRILVSDEKLREEMGKRGREYVVREHSWKRISEQLVRRFEGVISSG